MNHVVLSSGARLSLFGGLYFAQGVILSYFLTFNILYLRGHGFEADDIGFFQATLVLPFLLKILLGMLSDRFSLFGLGHRSPYMVVGLLLQCGCFLALPAVSLPEGLGTFFVIALLAAIGMALYDTSTDGLAVESTPEHERARVQGVMVGARAAGILCALLLGGYLADNAGWSAVFYMVAVLTLPALALALRFWQGDQSVTAGFSWKAFGALTRSDTLMLAATGVVYALALDGVLSFLAFHPDAGGFADIGTVSGLVAISMLGRILGAAASARLTARLGYRRSLQGAVVLSSFACLVLSVQAGSGLLAAGCLVFGFAYGYYTAGYSAVAMMMSDPRIAASMFAIFMMFLNIGVALGQGLGGVVTKALGFQGLAWLMALVGLVNLLLVRRLTAENRGP